MAHKRLTTGRIRIGHLIATEIRSNGIRKTARDTGIPLATVAKRACHPERLTIAEADTIARNCGYSLALFRV